MENNFYSILAEKSKELFQNPISEETKKVQKSLLIASAITIILCLSIIKVSNITISGVKIEIIRPNTISWILGFFILYYFILFITYVLQDLKIYNYNIKKTASDINDLIKNLKEKIINQYKELLNRATTMDDIFNDRKEIIDEMDNIRKRYKIQYEELDTKSKGRPDYPDEFEKIYERKKEELKPYRELLENIEQYDGLAAFQNETNEKAQDNTYNIQMGHLYKILKVKKRLEFLRWFIEILFPIFLSIYALYKVFCG